MNRALRNRLIDLLLEGFASPDGEAVLRWCASCCGAGGGQPDSDPPGLKTHNGPRPDDALLRGRPPDALRAPEALEGILIPTTLTCVPLAARWTVHPDVLPWLPAVRERLHAYLAVLDGWAVRSRRGGAEQAEARAVVQAALCFNAALFFEAHEVLESAWIRLPPGPCRMFLQGLIQISVGFHHARRGSYDGAVNQLDKGLGKLAGRSGRVLGLECDRFAREVATVRDRLVRRGRDGMRPLEATEIPRMEIVPDPA